MINEKYILILLFGIIACNPNEQHFKTSMSAKLYQKVRLPCFVESGHKFIWMKSDQSEVISIGDLVMTDRQEFRIESECDKTEYSYGSGCWIYLTIEKLKLIDEGVYVCQKDTMHSSYINLTILVPPYIKNEANSSMDINVIEGNDVELVCDAYGKPDPAIKWFAKNEYFITSEKILILRNISRHSLKDYECIADNGVNPSISRTFSLRILFAPTIIHFDLDKSHIIDRNTTLKFNLEFSGRPKPKITWIVDGEVKNSSNILNQLKDSVKNQSFFFASVFLKNWKINSLIEFKIENQLGACNLSLILKDKQEFSHNTSRKYPKIYSEKKRTILLNGSVKKSEVGHKKLLTNFKNGIKQKNNVDYLKQKLNFISLFLIVLIFV